MVIESGMGLAVAAVCLLVTAMVPARDAAAQRQSVTVKHAPIANPGDESQPWSAQQNVIQSKQYEQQLRTNPGFRKARMQKECGSINDPQLHQSCLASFEQ
jgi:hypothetical protein